MTNLRVPLQRPGSDGREQWQNPCDSDTKRFFIPARDSSHKYTPHGVNFRKFYAKVHRPPGPWPRAVTVTESLVLDFQVWSKPEYTTYDFVEQIRLIEEKANHVLRWVQEPFDCGIFLPAPSYGLIFF